MINKLGTGAIHANEGDLARQTQLDSELLSALVETFDHLLEVVYEAPSRHGTRLAPMQERVKKVDGGAQ